MQRSTDEPYDLMQGILSTKADERMIGFTSFVGPARADGIGLEGILKISAFDRDNGSGYLTLTFLLDRETLPPRADANRRFLPLPDQEILRQRLGPDFEMLIDLPLSHFSPSSNLYIEEMDVYFRYLQDREIQLVESRLIPAFVELLGLKFEPLQTWQTEEPEERASRILAEQEAALQPKPAEKMSFWRKLRGRG